MKNLFTSSDQKNIRNSIQGSTLWTSKFIKATISKVSQKQVKGGGRIIIEESADA